MKIIKKAAALLAALSIISGIISIPVLADTDAKSIAKTDSWFVTLKSGVYTTTANAVIRPYGSIHGFVRFGKDSISVTEGTVDEYIENTPVITLNMSQSYLEEGAFSTKIYGIAENKELHGSTATYDASIFSAGNLIGSVSGEGKQAVSIDVTDYIKSQTDGDYLFNFIGPGNPQLRYKDFTLNFDYSDAAKAQSAISAINIKTVAAKDFVLPLIGKFDMPISWSSSDSAIAIEGESAKVTLPAEGVEDKTVTLTAEIAVGEQSVTKDFVITLPSPETSNADTYAQAANADKNFDEQHCIYLNGSGRQNFMRFNKPDLVVNENDSVYLKMYLYDIKKPEALTEEGNFGITVLGLTGNDKISWREKTFTYQIGEQLGLLNKDADTNYGTGDFIGTTVVNKDLLNAVPDENTAPENDPRYVSIDVTEYVKSQKDGIYAFRMFGPSIQAYFYSRENETYPPLLVVQQNETPPTPPPSGNDEEDVNAAAEKLDIAKKVYGNFILPIAGENETTISWSSTSDLIAIDGANATAQKVEEPATVTLTATIEKGEVSVTKDFEITIASSIVYFADKDSGEEISNFTDGQHIWAGTLPGAEFPSGKTMYIAMYNTDGVFFHIWDLKNSGNIDITVNPEEKLGSVAVFIWDDNLKPYEFGKIYKQVNE